ncbi:MAG TPA: pectinesterase family protein [Rectinemataceae bacterium]|nr:pectinesterase family protein [Rectinemataceae bacterium]
MPRLRVAKEGPADFRTISAALAAMAAVEADPRGAEVGHRGGDEAVISIAAGIYREKLRIERPGVTLIGEGRDTTVISWDDHATKPLPSGEPMRTFNSYTLYIGSPDFQARDLRVENSAGDGRAVGQAVACYVDADRAAFYGCEFLARQDTLCLGPLPTNPLPKGLNPVHPVAIAKAGDESWPFRHYFADCRIEGDIDFIFGSAAAVFEDCDIISLERGEAVNGYVTAPSTLPGQRHGFVFLDCRLGGNAAKGSVFLGRPWRASAKAAFLRCDLGGHIAESGWDNWDNPTNERSAEFAEFENRGPGAAENRRGAANRRVAWARMLDGEAASRFTPPAVLSGADGWSPWTKSL